MTPGNLSFLLFTLLFGAILVYAAVLYGREIVQNLRQPVMAMPAEVAGRRIEEEQGSGWSPATHYFVTFTDERGSRTELAVSEGEYQRLRDGQRGVLRVQGVWYRGFVG